MAKINKDKVNNNTGKRAVTGLMFVGLFGVAVFGVTKSFEIQQREIEVAAFSKDVSIGNQIALSDLQPVKILKQEYDSRAEEVWTDSTGKTYSGQIYVKWSDVENSQEGLVGKFLTNSGRTGDYCTYRDVVTERIETNPWYSQVEDGQEIYTLSLDLEDTYTRLIMPGAVIRMRLVTKVEASQEQAYRDAIADKAGTVDGTESGFVHAVLPNFTTGDVNDKSGTVPVSEVVFDNITIIDALNSDGQSIFDIYYALYNMDSTAREEYIRENASSLRSTIMPEKLVLILDTDEASEVAEFEQISGTTPKFTIIKNEVEDELYIKFKEIANRISQIQLTSSSS